MESFIIISGGPGGGKTTLIDALAMLGHGRSIEAGRFIIRAQAAIGGMGVHLGDRELFAELMLMHEIRSYEEARGSPGLVFFDRGIPELTGYLPMVGRPLPMHFRRAAELYRYNRTVFVTPPWREIFANDSERRQDWTEAVRSYEFCVKTYREQGYDVIDLPKAGVRERARFVLDRLGAVSA
jgi:predicted ATPase